VRARATAKPTAGSAPLNVTFDARSSEDPSNDTIPSDNFYWYYTDTDGDEQTIGRGPVINYTFRDP
jgi:PKD repeat protein